MPHDLLQCCAGARRLVLVGLLGLLLGLLLLPELLLLVVKDLLVLLGAPRRLVAVRLGDDGGVVGELEAGSVSLLLLLLGRGGVGEGVGVRSLVLSVETLVGVVRGDGVSLAGLGVACCQRWSIR